MGIRLSEHKTSYIHLEEADQKQPSNSGEIIVSQSSFNLFESVASKSFNQSANCFHFQKKDNYFELKADYCIGLDWLGKTGRYVYVEPKVNSRTAETFNISIDHEERDDISFNQVKNGKSTTFELDYLKMLLQVTSVPESNLEIKDLLKIDWNAERIKIHQKEDKLTPFLVVHFLQILKVIVRKGLKREYYKIVENLPSRIKGKILIAQNIKKNILKNRVNNTVCEYQIFGEDHFENRFLKEVLNFASNYVVNNKGLFGNNYLDLQYIISYCRPAFERVSSQADRREMRSTKHNPFYKDYKEALQVGSHILKRFSYNITSTSEQNISTPPFWIDMPRLFEMFIYCKMVQANDNEKKGIHYQFSTYGNALDILVSVTDKQFVVDAKYKLHYQNSHLHEDIRQVAGYARLNKVRDKLNIIGDINIDCLIIYPDMEKGIDYLSLDNINRFKSEIKAYHKVFKLGVKLPWINSESNQENI